MIDKIVELVDGERIVGIKNVTANEPFFSGHFPGRPVMPGVMILECMAQTAAILAKVSTNGVGKGKILYLVSARDMKWKKPVIPGDTLRIVMGEVKHKGPLWMMTGEVFVGDKLVASGTVGAAEGA